MMMANHATNSIFMTQRLCRASSFMHDKPDWWVEYNSEASEPQGCATGYLSRDHGRMGSLIAQLEAANFIIQPSYGGAPRALRDLAVWLTKQP